jgi:multidrug efflux pump subunit AcrA (membrane-fusion protein)
MSAAAVIQTGMANDVLGVSTQAIQTASDGSSYVRVLKNGKISQVTVTTGLASDTDTEIKSGLSAGDMVVTGQTTPVSTSASTGASPFSSLGAGGGAARGAVRIGGNAGFGGGARRGAGFGG